MHAHWYSWYAIALLGHCFNARDTSNTEEKTQAQAIAREWVAQIADYPKRWIATQAFNLQGE